MRGIPPKNAIVKERHIHRVFVVNARSCRSRDANFPTTYHSRPVQHPGNSDPLPAHIFESRDPTRCFCKGLDHNTGSALPIIAAAIPKPAEPDDLRPHDMGVVHPFIFKTLHACCSPQISFFVVLTKDMCRQIGNSLS